MSLSTQEIRHHGFLVIPFITHGYKTVVLEFISIVDFINFKQFLVN